MTSEKQIAANRGNGQKSTGPKTEEGKAAVRLNALTYGLRARTAVLPWESPLEFKLLKDQLTAEWNPQTPTECLHLEEMIMAQWKLMRLELIEVMFAGERPDEQWFLEVRDLSPIETRYRNSFIKAQHELERLQEKRKDEQKPAPQTQPQPQSRPQAGPAALTPVVPINTPPPPEIHEPAYVMSAASQTPETVDLT